MRNEMNCCLSVIRGFQYEERNVMSVRLSHTWFPIWGMKWNVVCPSVIRGFQYEEWNEMLSVRLLYVVSNMSNEMNCFSVIRGFQYEEWNEMSVRLSHTWFRIWGMKWNVVCPSVIHGFQYEEWNEMKCCLSVCHTWFPIWGMKWNVCPSQSYVVSNMRNEMKSWLSVCHTWFPVWGMKWNVCPSVIRGFKYEEWNEMLSVRLSHMWFPIWGMKWKVGCPSVIHGFQYEKWNEMSVRLSYVVSNMRNEMKCLSVCHTWFPIWGMKWNVCPSVIQGFQYEESVSFIRGFQYEEWNEMYVRLSNVVSNMRNKMKCLSVCHTWFPIWEMKWPLKTRRLHSINGHFSTSRWRYLVTVAKQTTTLLNDTV